MCLKPIHLKNGNIVPCGNCLPCLNKKRNEWSIRTQIHTMQYDRMPFFVRLSYNDEELPYSEIDGASCLRKADVQDFLMRFRFNHDLLNTNFSYFGCGEYGSEENTDRPHYHLILFGCDFLYDIYERNPHEAENLIAKDWKHGFVDCQICRSMAAIHYCTKYTIKQLDDPHAVKPFTMASKGIGANWFDSLECKEIRKLISPENVRKYYIDLPSLYMLHDRREILANAKLIRSRIEPLVNALKVTLPSGKKVPMPRYYRKKVLGQFEHFKDNPLWFVNFIKQLIRTYENYELSCDNDGVLVRDAAHEREVAYAYRLKKLLKNECI